MESNKMKKEDQYTKEDWKFSDGEKALMKRIVCGESLNSVIEDILGDKLAAKLFEVSYELQIEKYNLVADIYLLAGAEFSEEEEKEVVSKVKKVVTSATVRVSEEGFGFRLWFALDE